LVAVVEERVVEGVPAFGRLGIGKGFDTNGGDAYAWPGVLDEVAIYDAVLPTETLREHLDVLPIKSHDEGPSEVP
jgi:hypothetical protein